MVSLKEKMSQLSYKVVGPDASFADFEMILLAWRRFVIRSFKRPRPRSRGPRRNHRDDCVDVAQGRELRAAMNLLSSLSSAGNGFDRAMVICRWWPCHATGAR